MLDWIKKVGVLIIVPMGIKLLCKSFTWTTKNNQVLPKSSEYESWPSLFKLRMLRQQTKKYMQELQKCRKYAIASDAIASGMSFIECSIHQNIGMVTWTRARMRYERYMRSAFRKIDHAGSNANNFFKFILNRAAFYHFFIGIVSFFVEQKFP